MEGKRIRRWFIKYPMDVMLIIGAMFIIKKLIDSSRRIVSRKCLITFWADDGWRMTATIVTGKLWAKTKEMKVIWWMLLSPKIAFYGIDNMFFRRSAHKIYHVIHKVSWCSGYHISLTADQLQYWNCDRTAVTKHIKSILKKLSYVRQTISHNGATPSSFPKTVHVEKTKTRRKKRNSEISVLIPTG